MSFNQDWFLRQVEMYAEGFMRAVLDKQEAHEQIIDIQQSAGDDLFFYRLCALLAKLELCAAEDLLWENLHPGEHESLLLAEEFYRRLGEFEDSTLEAHDFSRQEVRDGLDRARKFIGGVPE